MERGKRKSWAVLIVLSVLSATGFPADARSLRPTRARDDLSPPSVSGRNSNHREPTADVELLTVGLQELSAAASVLMDADTGAVLFAKNSRDRLPPASTTKIMTALLILEEGRLDDRVAITERAIGAGGPVWG